MNEEQLVREMQELVLAGKLSESNVPYESLKKGGMAEDKVFHLWVESYKVLTEGRKNIG